MAIYFVSRHSGARDWAGRHAPEAVLRGHLDIDDVASGDIVLGTLPVPLAAAVTARGGRYFHLVFDVTEGERGTEFSADELERRGSRLLEFRVTGAGAEQARLGQLSKHLWEDEKS